MAFRIINGDYGPQRHKGAQSYFATKALNFLVLCAPSRLRVFVAK